MSNEQIENILEMYKKKKSAENYLHKLEHKIIEERAMSELENYGTIFGKVNYHIIGNDKFLKEQVERKLKYSTERESSFRSNYFYINVREIIATLKLQLYTDLDFGDYVSLALFFSEPGNYSFSLEISAHKDEKLGDVLIINGIKLNENGKAEKLIQYSTTITNHNILYGDEKSVIELNDEEVILHIED